MSEMEYMEDVWKETWNDYELGAMTAPEPLTPEHLKHVNVARRFPVRELRASGWRTRVVDHETENAVNLATHMSDRTKGDTLDSLVQLLRLAHQRGLSVALWKRDISRAFRRVPVRAAHLPFAFVVFEYLGKQWITGHTCMPFGSISAVLSWHRVGGAIRDIVEKLFLVPILRYVDDYFGIHRQKLQFTGGVCLDLVAGLLGFPCDASKSADHHELMKVLGACVQLHQCRHQVQVFVPEDRRLKYLAAIKEATHTALDSGQASKVAGQLSWTVTLAADKIGRAYIKPFFAQAHAPRPVPSFRMRLAAHWWEAYLAVERRTTISLSREDRKQALLWTDAAGESRLVAAVLALQQDDQSWQWWYVVTELPHWIWVQLQERGDHQIGVQEMAGIILGLHVFRHELEGRLLVSFQDNDGVLGSVLKGSSRADEINVMVAHLWIDCADRGMGLCMARVESAANVADGPTRHRWDLLRRLGAAERAAEWPTWMQNLWHLGA